MRFGPAMLIAAVLLAPVAASPLQVAFAPPGQWTGEVGVDGTWLIVTMDSPQAGDLRLEVPHATSINHTIYWTGASILGEAHVSGRPLFAPSQEEGQGRIEADVTFAKQGRATLVVLAERVTVASGSASGEITVLEAGSSPRRGIQMDGRAGSFVRAAYDVSGHVAVNHIDAPPTILYVEAVGIQRMEWINATASCQSSFCPSGGGIWGLHHDDSTVRARGYAFSFTELVADAGSLSGQLDASTWAVGGASVNASVGGWLRLPVAQVEGECSCLDASDHSLQAQGNLSLTELHGTESGLAGVVGGNASWLRLDEKAVDPSLVGSDSVEVVGVAVASGLLVSLLAALQVRNRNRRRVQELVAAKPGITFRGLMRDLDLSSNTVRHHLDKLLASGGVVHFETGRTHHYYENHGRYGAADRAARAALQDDASRVLLGLLIRVGWIREKHVLRHAKETWSWNPSTTQRRLRRLVDAGLVSTTKQQGRWYEATRLAADVHADESGNHPTVSPQRDLAGAGVGQERGSD